MVFSFCRLQDERFISQMEIRLYVSGVVNKILIHTANRVAVIAFFYIQVFISYQFYTY